MKVLIFGATGMVGYGVLQECLKDSQITLVQTVGRSILNLENPKLKEIKHADLYNYKEIENQLQGFDACFFCLGISVAGLSEAEYTRITYDLTRCSG